jgi:predicted phage-related endonuclease
MTRARRLKIERRKITTRAEWLAWRRQDLTASTIGCLFGLHPYQTLAGLWAEKLGHDFGVKETSVMRRGRLLEKVVAEAFLEEHPGWKVIAPGVYLRAPSLRLACTPDFYVIDPQGRRGVLQTKTVSPSVFRKSWDETSAPMWINLQTLTETQLSRAAFGMIGALVVGDFTFELHCYDVPSHDGAWRRIQDAVAKFWADVAAGKEPQIDYKRDGDLIAALYPHETPGKVIDLRTDNHLPDLLASREAVKAVIKKGEGTLGEIETEIKAKLGDAEGAMINGWYVTLKQQTRKAHTVKESSFRVLRATAEKEEAP